MSNREAKLAALRKLEQRTTERSKAQQLFSCALRAVGAAIEAAALRRGLSAAAVAEKSGIKVSRVLLVFAGSDETGPHDYMWPGGMLGLRVRFELDGQPLDDGGKHTREAAAAQGWSLPEGGSR